MNNLTSRKSNNHSFAILAYKKSKYLEVCIQSLLEQTSRDFVYISTSTPSAFISDIAEKYNITVHVNPEGGSIANDWSFALQKAKTKYVTLAHQDDVYFNEYSEKMLANAERANDAVIIFCDYVENIDKKNRTHTLLLLVKRILLLPFYMNAGTIRSTFIKRLALAFGSPICCPSVTYNINLIGNFSFDNNFKINLDWDAWVRLSKLKGSFVFVPERLMAHRIHLDAATTTGIKNNQRQKEDLILFQRLWGKSIAKILSIFYSLSYKLNSHSSNSSKP